MLVARPARADAYAWELASGRLYVSVLVPGFNDGAGEGGWNEDSAREDAASAKRFNAVIPAGARVAVAYDGASDDVTTLTIRDAAGAEVVTMEGQPDLDVALAIVAAHFHASVPATSPATLYTVQLLAVRSSDRAESFSQSLDARGVAAEGSFYEEQCLPCITPQTRVIDPDARGFYRVISGVFDEPAKAEEAAAKLRRAHVAAWARVLE